MMVEIFQSHAVEKIFQDLRGDLSSTLDKQ